MFWCKVFSNRADVVVAICDEEILGRKIKMRQDGFKIEISKNFYGGKLIDENIAVRVMKKATIGNLMGKRIIDLASQKGFIIKENVIFIDDVPHAQFVKI